jgi:23S rRNA (adenine2503-C2)-methyltransferase
MDLSCAQLCGTSTITAVPSIAHFFNLDRDQLRELLAGCGMPPFRGDQVLDWVYAKHVADPRLMLNVPKADRAKLADCLQFTRGRVVQHQCATDGVQKLLVEWTDESAVQSPESCGQGHEAAALPRIRLATLDSGVRTQDSGLRTCHSTPHARHPAPAQTECVMIPVDDLDETGRRERRTACVSSQVGCPVGCRFCASGIGGLESDLTAGQIVEQVWRLATLEGVGRITNVVFMGMGEPLANFSSVVRAIRLLTAEWGLNISARRVTVSTVGVPAPIRRLADLELPVTLALSLHAPNDELRRRLIPWAEYVTIEQLAEACAYYFDRTGREITLEYILLGGVNDRPEHAKELAGVARRLRAHVNLIRYNEVKGMPFDRPGTPDVHLFQRVLRNAGVNVHIRASRGRDIAAACGQLRHEQAGR